MIRKSRIATPLEAMARRKIARSQSPVEEGRSIAGMGSQAQAINKLLHRWRIVIINFPGWGFVFAVINK